jgi:hypothetical protein
MRPSTTARSIMSRKAADAPLRLTPARPAIRTSRPKQQLLRVAPDLPTTFLAPLLNLPLDTLVTRLTNDKVDGFIDLENAKGLLALERAGRNRTDWVKALDDVKAALSRSYQSLRSRTAAVPPTVASNSLIPSSGMRHRRFWFG